jgi:hypothetical protein
MDRTLSRQLVHVCTGIFLSDPLFLTFRSSAARGASHQHFKMVRKSYRAYKLIELDRHMKHVDDHQPKSSWYISEMVTLRSNKRLPHAIQMGANDAPRDWLQYVLRIESRTSFFDRVMTISVLAVWQSGTPDGSPRQDPFVAAPGAGLVGTPMGAQA